MRSINWLLVASNLPPVNRLEECVIHVASRNEAEHEQTQHNHNLLLHSGQTQHALVASGRRRGGRAGGRTAGHSGRDSRGRRRAAAAAVTLRSAAAHLKWLMTKPRTTTSSMSRHTRIMIFFCVRRARPCNSTLYTGPRASRPTGHFALSLH